MSLNNLTAIVTILVTATALMHGLFSPGIDNTEIFKLISPAFQTIIGGFIGLLAGIKLKSIDASEH